MYINKDRNFLKDIEKMTLLYEQPKNDKPTLLGVKQLENFKSIILEEVGEVDKIIGLYKSKESSLNNEDKIVILTEMADWLGDIVVYCTNEATKHGINLAPVLDIIMQSNFSKLGSDGKPIKDERGKFLKGPNYWKPEPEISELFKKQLSE
jgi:predicted HAD superfamily Cof-like phosphohydrolase